MALEPRMMFDGAMLATAEQVAEHISDQISTSETTTIGSDQSLVDALNGGTAPDPVLLWSEPQIGTEAPILFADPEIGSVAPVMWADGLVGSEAPVIWAEPQVGSVAPEPAGREVVFVDADVNDLPTIIAAIPAGTEIVTLQGGVDGLDQIATYLSGTSGVSAIHIISHGESGSFELGGQVIDEAALAAHADDLAVIKSSLTESGDILLYGCDVGQGSAGEAFMRALAEATAADVAASTDATGAEALGGDWDLEARLGEISTPALRALDWFSTLATTINPTGGVLADSSDGLRIYVGNNGQLQIARALAGSAAGMFQLYSPATTGESTALFNGIYLAIGNQVYPPEPSRVMNIAVRSGQMVQAGDQLAQLYSPEIGQKQQMATLRLAVVKAKLARIAADNRDLAQSAVLQEEAQALQNELDGLARREALLDLRAPIAGRVGDVIHGAAQGVWLGREKLLMHVVAPQGAVVAGLVNERDQARLALGRQAVFIAENGAEPEVTASLVEIGSPGGEGVENGYLSSLHGGPVAMAQEGGRAVSVSGVLPVRFAAMADAPLMAKRGTLTADSEPTSLLGLAFGRLVLVFLRESGF